MYPIVVSRFITPEYLQGVLELNRCKSDPEPVKPCYQNLLSRRLDVGKTTRWALDPVINGAISPINGFINGQLGDITPVITGRGPPCTNPLGRIGSMSQGRSIRCFEASPTVELKIFAVNDLVLKVWIKLESLQVPRVNLNVKEIYIYPLKINLSFILKKNIYAYQLKPFLGKCLDS